MRARAGTAQGDAFSSKNVEPAALPRVVNASVMVRRSGSPHRPRAPFDAQEGRNGAGVVNVHAQKPRSTDHLVLLRTEAQVDKMMRGAESACRTSAIAVLVVVSIALNALAGFLPLQARWFAAKEALLPVVFGGLFATTALRGPGLLADLIHELVDPARLAAALAARDATAAYTLRLRRGTLAFGGVLAASGGLGGALALALVTSPTGTPGFAEELGRYTAWSYLVVNVPVLAATTWVMRDVLLALEDGTGKRLEDLRAEPPGP
jgi:hypothetical protein